MAQIPVLARYVPSSLVVDSEYGLCVELRDLWVSVVNGRLDVTILDVLDLNFLMDSVDRDDDFVAPVRDGGSVIGLRVCLQVSSHLIVVE